MERIFAEVLKHYGSLSFVGLTQQFMQPVIFLAQFKPDCQYRCIKLRKI